MALQDAQRTVGLVRFHAAEWHIDPHKIGVLGFSAGGHMCSDEHSFKQRSTRLSMQPTKKAAARILRWLFIQAIYGLTIKIRVESGYPYSYHRPDAATFCCRRRMTTWTM